MSGSIRRRASTTGYHALVGLACCLSLVACDGTGGTPVSSPGDPSSFNLSPDDELGGGGGGGGGGGETVPPFDPPPPPFFRAHNQTTPGTNGFDTYCEQVPHAFFGFSNDVVRGTPIYVTGVVVKNTQMYWGVYNRFGQLVKLHETQKSRDNCVVHHEAEDIGTGDLAPGYYYLYASYVKIVDFQNQEVRSGVQQTETGRYIGVIRVR